MIPGLLQGVRTPADLRRLDIDELDALAAEIRHVLVEHVASSGGHLGSNLGIVELTLALHRVCDSPRDAIVWDTGHQSYVHKLVTGRADQFATLRQRAGLSGYTSRAESPSIQTGSVGTASGSEALQNVPAPLNTYAKAWLVVSTGSVFLMPAGIETSR